MLQKIFRNELSDFAALFARQISGDIESTKSQMSADLETKLPAIEEKICKNVETKVAIIVEDVPVKGSCSFLTSGPFDSLAGPDIAIVTEVPGTSEVSTPTTQEPPAKRKCVSTRSEPGKPTKKSVQKKYSWKKENPKGGEFLFEKCAAVRHRRVQHIKELIYD